MNGRLSDAWLEELRSRVSLEEVVSEYVPMKQKGRRFWGCCPFHNEKTPSFSVDTQAQLYYCFGCHKGGTVINFIMDMERMEFIDAVKLLAERAHMELPESSYQPGESRTSRDERERMYEANRLTARYFHDLLWTEEGAQALNYLYGRGLNDSDIRRFGLGASPKGWDGLLHHLEEQGFEEALLEKAGLIVRRDSGRFDMFRGRVMFPIINAQGRVLGFGGRAIGDAQPKYLNTAETPIFNKRLGLYALNFVQKERSVGHLVLVEGYMDTVSLRKYGVKGVVATLGTALTEEQARLMKRYAPEVWISYDGDAAGQKAALRALDIFDRQGMPAKVIDYPSGMDPDDFIKAKGLAGFESLPRHDSTDYRMLRARDGLDLSTQDGMTQYALRCCAILGRVKSPIEMENYLRRLVNETGYDREILLRQIGAAPRDAAQAPRGPRRSSLTKAEASGAEKAEQELISMLAAELIPAQAISGTDFSNPVHRDLAEWLISGKSANAYIDNITDDAVREQVMCALNYSPLVTEKDKALEVARDCLDTIRRQRESQRDDQFKQQVNTASPEKKAEIYRQLEASWKESED
ncbi:MAG: DNA primase [Clostridia bacterium]|nr:DNA primase [Clostridia bacterium]